MPRFLPHSALLIPTQIPGWRLMHLSAMRRRLQRLLTKPRQHWHLSARSGRLASPPPLPRLPKQTRHWHLSARGSGRQASPPLLFLSRLRRRWQQLGQTQLQSPRVLRPERRQPMEEKRRTRLEARALALALLSNIYRLVESRTPRQVQTLSAYPVHLRAPCSRPLRCHVLIPSVCYLHDGGLLFTFSISPHLLSTQMLL